MKRLLETASRTALITLIAATPVAAIAATDSADMDPLKKQQTEMTGDAPAAVMDETETEMDTAADEVAPLTDETETDLAADQEMTPDAMTDEPVDMAADGAPLMADDMAEETDLAMEDTAQPVEGQITMQDANTVLAEDLLGATVYNDTDENVGDINDLIIGLDGTVKGVVIGVGGFLGLGEKDVAVEMAALDVIDRDGGSPRLVTSSTKADLEAAPEFIPADEQAAARQMGDMPSTTGTMGDVAQPTE